MRIVIAPDKFKGSLSAIEVCKAIESGLTSSSSSFEIISAPLADGGDGTSDLLIAISNGSRVKVRALDPLLREVETEYGISGDGQTAFIEMAKVSGLQMLKPSEQNPMNTSSYGTGQLIADAIKNGVRKIILGIGGTATNDAGMGMATALGYSMSFDRDDLSVIGKNLIHLRGISSNDINPLIEKTDFRVLCDVTNPLYGKTGAAYTYGPQKGASEEEIFVLDQGLINFEKVVRADLKKESDFDGAGAAGGVGAGAKVFLNAKVHGGFQFISQFSKLEEKIAQADLVITGEGKIDSQSLTGKVIGGVAELARRHGKTCIAVAGKCELNQTELSRLGISRSFSLSDSGVSESESIREAAALLKKVASDFLII